MQAILKSFKSTNSPFFNPFWHNWWFEELFFHKTYEPQYEKTNNVDSDQVSHKPGCTATVDG